MTEPFEWTATEAVRRITRRELTRAEYLGSCLARIAALEDAVGAWTHLGTDAARQRAAALDHAADAAPLSGIPFGTKDIIDTADMPTELGSPIHRGDRPTSDAACVALLRRAGAIALGKTVTTEFANVHPGKTRNPFDPARTPGGSSSGSAAAVGAGMVPLALGTQTTGSTIRPASFCGAFGFIPTQGRVSCSGVRQSSWTLDRLGLLARSAEDIALLDDVVRGAAPTPLRAPAQPPRIGFCRTHLWDRVEPSTATLLETAAADLGRRDAVVAPLELQPEFAGTAAAHRWISSFEFTKNYAYEIDNHHDRISAALRKGRIADGQSCSYEQYEAALVQAQRSRMAFDAVFRDHDVLMTVSAAGEAPAGTATGEYAFCALWTALQVPCITIPAFTGPNGLPVGLQLIGRAGADRALLAHAAWVAKALGVPGASA